VFLRHAIDRYKFSPGTHKHLETVVLEADSVKSRPDPYLIWIWKQGEIFEEIMTENVKVLGVYIQDQVQVFYPGVNVRGKIDLVALNPVTDKKTVVEFKSVYGYNANSVLGSPAQRRKGELGTPRDSNLMQIAIYQHGYKDNPDFEAGRLIYGSRDTGRTAEYLVEVDSQGVITYQGNYPVRTRKTKAPYTMGHIFANYEFINEAIARGELPDRDFELKYSNEKILQLFAKGKLNKTETQTVQKHLNRQKENQVRQAEGKKPLKELRLPEKGDWACDICNLKHFCYKADGSPRV